MENLGEGVTGLCFPVSVCMLLTVFLVKTLNPVGRSNADAVYIASIYYHEDASDSIWTKFEGSMINAMAFVVIVAAMTYGLVLLLKHGYTKWIFYYLGFSGFTTFFVISGAIILELLQRAEIGVDWVSFVILLTNFALVGGVTLFAMPAPLLLKQTYLIVLSCSVAYIFTFIPEWTAWVLLLGMSAYDLFAVLVDVGPLKKLVELAEERDEDIPALVYQSRPSTSKNVSRERIETDHAVVPEQEGAGMSSPRPQEGGEEDSEPLVQVEEADGHEHSLSGIKLGLGDFIFYSVLVGRAAMFDALTTAACFVAILAGLGCTLLWLSISRRALPALPISVALATLFYFLSRFALEPVIMPMVCNMVYF